MKYVLIEEKAWLEIIAHAGRMNESIQKLERHFDPAGGTG